LNIFLNVTRELFFKNFLNQQALFKNRQRRSRLRHGTSETLYFSLSLSLVRKKERTPAGSFSLSLSRFPLCVRAPLRDLPLFPREILFFSALPRGEEREKGTTF